MTFTADIGNY